MSEAAEDFWRYSLALYARPGVASACLRLQDERSRDVNLMLFCCWIGASGRGRLDRAGIVAADAAVAPWRRGAIEPLRRARRALKEVAGAAALYDQLKAIELEAERQAQALLTALAPSPTAAALPERQAAAAGNLRLYLGEDQVPEAAPIFAALAGDAG